MFLRKMTLLFCLLMGFSSPLMAVVYVETFDDPLGGWTTGWLYSNSNMENYYVAGGNCDPNTRGNNPSGLWISDDKGCGTLVSESPVRIDFLNGIGDAATQFSIGACRFGGDLTLNVYDKDDALDQTVNVPGGCPGTGASLVYTAYPFDLTNGISRFEFVGSGIEGNTAIDDVTLSTDAVVDVPEKATFYVTKDFTDDNPMPVEVTLTCNTGLPLTQSFMISDPGAGEMPVGSLNLDAAANGVIPTASSGVNFVVTNFVDGAMDCTVTETVPDNYTVEYDDGTISSTNCSYDAVVTGTYSCAITNTADPATFTVNKEWIIPESGGGDDVIREAEVVITCNMPILNGDQQPGGVGDTPHPYIEFTKTGTITGDGELMAIVDTRLGPAMCSGEETSEQSGVEVTDDCEVRTIAAGGSSECTITNSVFFEGIPSLNQYGLALMALLMLGVGFIGFRRFA